MIITMRKGVRVPRLKWIERMFLWRQWGWISVRI